MREGMQVWQNPRNQLYVCRLHYTADPAKRSTRWKNTVSKNLPRRGWQREYEINWATPEGEPVVPEFTHSLHVRQLEIDPLLRPLRIWDFGNVSPAVLFGQHTTTGQLLIQRELVPFNTPLRYLWPMTQAVLHNTYNRRDVFDAGDPAGENQTDLGSSAEFLVTKGVRLHCTRPGTEISYAALRGRFQKMVLVPGTGLEPAILIDPQCRNLIDALTGAFHLSPNPPYKPIKKHPFKDVVDALRYGNDCLSMENQEFHRQLQQMARNDRLDDVGAYHATR